MSRRAGGELRTNLDAREGVTIHAIDDRQQTLGTSSTHPRWAVITTQHRLPPGEAELKLGDTRLHLHFADTGNGPTTYVASTRPAPRPTDARRDFRVIAVMTAFNEADIIGGILDRAGAEGLQVHLIDNWSTDSTADVAMGHAAVVEVERFPRRRPRHYEWKSLLHRVEQIAASTDADWVIHHDADEWRTSPWPGVPMIDALQWVSDAGYNAIDHTVVVHTPTDDRFAPGQDVTRQLPYFSFGTNLGHFTQIKGWRTQAGGVDLASSGGHEASFDGRRVFPFNFLLRHYPIRSQAHGERKVLQERRPRWSPAEKRRGWHNQYDQVEPETRFVRDPSDLHLFDERTFYRRFMFERLARIGIDRR
jgi:hypothetical protein